MADCAACQLFSTLLSTSLSLPMTPVSLVSGANNRCMAKRGRMHRRVAGWFNTCSSDSRMSMEMARQLGSSTASNRASMPPQMPTTRVASAQGLMAAARATSKATSRHGSPEMRATATTARMTGRGIASGATCRAATGWSAWWRAGHTNTTTQCPRTSTMLRASFKAWMRSHRNAFERTSARTMARCVRDFTSSSTTVSARVIAPQVWASPQDTNRQRVDRNAAALTAVSDGCMANGRRAQNAANRIGAACTPRLSHVPGASH